MEYTVNDDGEERQVEVDQDTTGTSFKCVAIKIATTRLVPTYFNTRATVGG